MSFGFFRSFIIHVNPNGEFTLYPDDLVRGSAQGIDIVIDEDQIYFLRGLLLLQTEKDAGRGRGVLRLHQLCWIDLFN